ncbi:MAG: DUF4838 domain-containing protein [Verrucomicrobiales bacterium]|nr:DUF4838 domain-containing protein [Verrucomicrobiales bacterium]
MRGFVVLFTVFLFTLITGFGGELILGEGGKSDYRIVLPDKPPAPGIDASLVQTARLLQTAFLANDISVPVLRESELKGNPGIYLGNTSFARQQGLDVTTLEGWSYFHRLVGGRNLILAGHDHPASVKSVGSRRPEWDRVGTAKAVVDFLREYVGVRFLFPEMGPYRALSRAEEVDFLHSPAIEFLPTPRIAVPDDLDITHSPAIEFSTAHPQGGAFYDLAHNRFPRVDEVFRSHTWKDAVPPAKYAKTHPEYFALVRGKRLADDSLAKGREQYCLSNPAVQELIYKDLAANLDKGLASVDIGQPDGFRACECDQCKALYDTGDDWGEKIWIFNRTMAERLLKSHPDGKISMISYIQTASPPKTFRKFPANTRITLTGTNESDIAPWRGYDVPGGFTGYLYNWCPNLGTRYTPMRTPLFVEKQAKRLHTNRVKGFHRDGPGALFGLEGPVHYTMGRMYDDPENLTADLLVPEFIDAAFLESSFFMKRFYDRLFHTITLYSDQIGTRCPTWTYEPMAGRRRKTVSDPFRMIAFLYPPKALTEMENWLASAERKARNTKVKQRLALVRREFDYIKHFARVVHLHQAFEMQPDLASRDRLLDAIDTRNAEIATYFNERGRPTPVSNGWSYVMFPPAGHNEAHMRLAHNNYQEPYEDTCFNWDTTAMRGAPLPGAKQLPVTQLTTQSPLSLSAPEWDKAESHPLNGGEGAACKVLADTANIYICIDAPQSENVNDIVAVYLQPNPGSDYVWRFRTGPDSASRDAAAAGFVSDVMDPRYGQFDPDWKGEWRCQTGKSEEYASWQAMFTIPFSSLSTTAPQPGAFWRANVVRLTGAEISAWSTSAGFRNPDDRNAFGEWLFGAEPAEK